jgi:uncharacterized protein YukE
MSRHRDNSTIPNTCPNIDAVIRFVNSNIPEFSDEEYQHEYEQEKKAVLQVLEEIRDANQGLRNWGNEMYNDRESFEAEVDALKNTIDGLESEIRDLQLNLELA